MTAHHPTDIIDLLAGLDPESEVAVARAARPAARSNAQLSFEALLEPAEPGSFPLRERYAVALFVAQLHEFAAATEFYADVLGDADHELVWQIRGLAPETRAAGPAGQYREVGLAAESTAAAAWQPGPDAVAALGVRLAAALAHAHLLVVRPREATASALAGLVRAGWSADDTVSLSQLISFLTFQLRLAWGLRVLAGTAPADELRVTPDPAPAGPVAAGEVAVGLVADPAAAAPAAADPAGERAPDPAVAQLITTYPTLSRPEAFTQRVLGWVPWLAPVAEADLTDAQREALIEPARAKLPYFRLLARDPEALKARTLADLDIFFNTDGGIGRAERELAATAASRANGCVYCASVHSAAATRESGRDADVQRLLDAGVTAELGDPVWNAVARAAVALTATPLRFGEDDVRALTDLGLGTLEVLDVIGGAAFFNWANRLMLSLGEPEARERKPAHAG